MTPRTLKRLHPAQRDDIGDLTTRRPLPGPAIPHLDPFLFLNHHGPQVYPPNNRGLPFGPHPHRGFETVTFILDGELSHLDSGGHESVIGPGGVQWMTAGSGLVHAELSPASFKQTGGPLEILQLWVNLPSQLKMTKPNYLGLQGPQIPKVVVGGTTIEVVSGEVAGVVGPFPSLIGIEMSVVRLAPGATLTLPVAPGRAVFLYVVSGEIAVGDQTVPRWNLVELNDDGDLVVFDSAAGAVVLLGHAEPIGEPIFAHGPFVMNTREEIVQAIDDYNAGKFGNVPG
jgi:redox-sensitive bicupin YhaK (pirin superfamily)